MKTVVAAAMILLGSGAAQADLDPSSIHWDDGTPVLPRGLPPSFVRALKSPAPRHGAGFISGAALAGGRYGVVLLKCKAGAPGRNGTTPVVCQAPSGGDEVDSQSTVPHEPTDDEGMDATPTSPPMITADPGTPGANILQIGMGVTGDFAPGVRTWQIPTFSLTYGIGEDKSLSFSIPNEWINADGGSDIRGLGDFSAGFQWRFYEKDGLEMAVAPAYTGPNVWNLHPESSGLAGPGGYFYLPILVQKSVGQNQYGKIQLVGNLGYTQALDRRNSSFMSESVALGVPVSKSIAVLGEVYGQQATTADVDGNRAQLVGVTLGVVKQINDAWTVCASVGRCGDHTLIVLGAQYSVDLSGSQK